MKTIIPQKLVIDTDGTLKGAVLVYRIQEDGNLSKAKTVSVVDGLVTEQAEALINAAIGAAETSEGII